MRTDADTGEGTPELIDLEHLGRPAAIGAWVLGDVIVDPGPASCLGALTAGLAGREPRALALTHIHLDHAGAAGVLAGMFPAMEVWVHERGARHLADPSKLLASATRLYGAEMERLWGEVLPVPEERIRILRGGETLAGMRVAYTPGHASHHVSYLHEASGYAFAGDVAGVRIGGGPTLAPTPPPDIDLPAWRESIALVEAWSPAALAITHFGSYEDPGAQLGELREYLDEVEDLAARLDEEDFAAAVRERLSSRGGSDVASTYGHATPVAQSYAGLRRYLERAS
ncbi:MAG TPA: MBL fold metallo-hydrolase [Solirubrobacteraceae bacterium]|nr:MBL fold metallo-hydrolase [Solirubrobacteraceae bacterium]